MELFPKMSHVVIAHHDIDCLGPLCDLVHPYAYCDLFFIVPLLKTYFFHQFFFSHLLHTNAGQLKFVAFSQNSLQLAHSL